MAELIADVLGVLAWLLVVWVCVYDWDDGGASDAARERLRQRRAARRRHTPGDGSGNKFPGN